MDDPTPLQLHLSARTWTRFDPDAMSLQQRDVLHRSAPRHVATFLVELERALDEQQIRLDPRIPRLLRDLAGDINVPVGDTLCACKLIAGLYGQIAEIRPLPHIRHKLVQNVLTTLTSKREAASRR